MRKLTYTCVLLFCVISVMAQQTQTKKLREKTTTITWSMPFGSDVSPKQAQSQVLEAAKIQAIGNEFGWQVSMENRTRVKDFNGTSSTSFVSFGESDVQGEWLQTIGEPKWNKKEEDKYTVYTVTLNGRIRELPSFDIDLDIKLLCNGVDTLTNRLRMDTYYHGDSAYVYFKSPIDGYLAIYITDELSDNKIAQRLLPYPHQGGAAYPVLADEDYYFFSKNKAPSKDRRYVVTQCMGCYDQIDINKIYVIFSPHPFVKATDISVSADMPDQLPLNAFHKWLLGNRRHDSEMVVKPFLIEIRKP